MDFVHGTDKIHLDDAIFKAIGSSLTSSEFRVVTSGNAAGDDDDRLIYNKTDGKLWYDARGKAAGAAVQIAVLSGSPDNVTYQDFAIV